MASVRSIESCNVCVVGGAGFLGSHLVNHLIEDRDCYVLVVDNLCSGRREFIHNKAQFEHHDITGSENHLLKLFQQHQIEYVFNYAAHPYIPVSFERPLYVFDTNAMGALKVINAAQEAGCKGILQVSSAEIYGRGYGTDDMPSSVRLDENAPVIPHSTYGTAKAAIDALIQVRWKEAKTPCIALRQFNCIGERETHPYVVPEIISQLHPQKTQENICGKGKPVVRLGNNSFRDFQYAGDAVRNAVLLLESEQYGEVFNMGSEDGVKMYDLAKLIGLLMGFETVKVQVDQARVRPWEIWHLQSDNSKLWKTIGKQPVISLQESLKKTIRDFILSGNKWSWQ